MSTAVRRKGRYYRLGDRVMNTSDWARELNVSYDKFYTRWPSQVGLTLCDRYGVTDADALENGSEGQRDV